MLTTTQQTQCRDQADCRFQTVVLLLGAPYAIRVDYKTSLCNLAFCNICVLLRLSTAFVPMVFLSAGSETLSLEI